MPLNDTHQRLAPFLCISSDASALSDEPSGRQSTVSMRSSSTSSIGSLSVSMNEADLEQYKQREAELDEVLLSLEAEYISDEGITFRADDGAIKTGSLEKLVERLTWHRRPDSVYSLAFLLTYHSFTDGITLLRLLQDRFTTPLPDAMAALPETDIRRQCYTERILEPVRLRVFNIVKTWVRGTSHE